jgi:putative colanic acid biosynthesis glycosyltransferase
MLFSIVTVTRNNCGGLKKTAESLMSQEYDGFEWIIIDGNSTDGSKSDFSDYTENLRATIVSEEDDGPYDAMNKGMALATGTYVLFLNSGDTLAQTQTLKKIKESVWLSRPDFIYGDAWEFSKGRTWYKPARAHAKIDKGMFTHHQSMFYKKDVIEDLTYDSDFKIAADYDFTLRFLNRAATCLRLSFPLCVFEAGGLSQRNVTRGRKEQFAIRQKHKISTLPVNVVIYTTQIMSWGLRACAPGLYWKLKGFKQEEEKIL